MLLNREKKPKFAIVSDIGNVLVFLSVEEMARGFLTRAGIHRPSPRAVELVVGAIHRRQVGRRTLAEYECGRVCEPRRKRYVEAGARGPRLAYNAYLRTVLASLRLPDEDVRAARPELQLGSHDWLTDRLIDGIRLDVLGGCNSHLLCAYEQLARAGTARIVLCSNIDNLRFREMAKRMRKNLHAAGGQDMAFLDEDRAALSFRVGARKPDRAIYKRAFDLAGVDRPEQALFIDDCLDNVEAAKVFGFQGYLFDPMNFTDSSRVFLARHVMAMHQPSEES